MRAVMDLLSVGALGRITRTRFRNAHHGAYGRWFDSSDLEWFRKPELAGGGAFLDLGTHAVHLLRTLMGPVKEVWAELCNEAGIYPKCDDFGVALLRFANGVLGTIEAGWTRTGGIGDLEVVGSERTLWNTGTHYVVAGPGKDPQPVQPADDRPAGLRRLVAVVRGELPAEEWQTDLAYTVDTVAIMEACHGRRAQAAGSACHP